MKFRLLIIFLMLSTLVKAQEYKHFRVVTGVAYLVSGSYHTGGLFFLEPSYRIRKAVSVGLRLEGGMAELDGASNTFMAAYSFNGQYYFSQGNVRPFAGLGMGFYTFSPASTMCDCSHELKQNVPGFYPRLGVDVGHLSIGIEYTVIQKIKETSTSFLVYPDPSPMDIKPDVQRLPAHYLSARIAFFIGGGRKKP